MIEAVKPYDTFLSHSHDDAAWVEDLAARLSDECGFQIWLDKWVLIPGKSWQQAMAKGLNEAPSCAVCIGGKTPRGWLEQEIERALDLQTRDEEFRVIPVLLPDASPEYLPAFLTLRIWADFRDGADAEYAFHVLKQGIKGEPVGRWRPNREEASEDYFAKYAKRIVELGKFRTLGVHEEVVIEYERKILDRWLDEEGDE